ncbi:MAG: DUF5694 domain-containing protein [Bacteroidota bacterium]
MDVGKTHRIFPLLLIVIPFFIISYFNENKDSNTKTGGAQNSFETYLNEEEKKTKKIQVLNFATFHMANTNDSLSIEFDETNNKNRKEARRIAHMISKFQPTIICVEVPYESNNELNVLYRQYLKNPENKPGYPGEVGLIAFEVGRLHNIERLYAIDHKMDYDYNISQRMINYIDSTTFNNFHSNPFADYPELNPFIPSLSLKQKLRIMNNPRFLDLLILINADMLTYVGTKDGFEGADEAAKYYKRNLRIFSNLNRIPLQLTDRVFILSGGSHTAFLNEFMKRSPKYEVVEALRYL